MFTLLSTCWRSILLTTTWHVSYCFHVCVLYLKNIHTIVSSLQLMGIPSLQQLAFSLYQGGFVSWRLQDQELLRQQQRQCQSLVRMRKGVSQQQEHVNGMNANQRSDKMRYCRLIGQQRQCQSFVRMRKGVSQQQEHVNGVNTNQRSDKMRYGRLIGQGMQRGVHVCQRSDKVKYGRPIGQGMQRCSHVC
jgi:hypothetical protein